MSYLITLPPQLRKELENHSLTIFPLPGSIVLGSKLKWCALLSDYMIRTYGDTPEEALSEMESELVKMMEPANE